MTESQVAAMVGWLGAAGTSGLIGVIAAQWIKTRGELSSKRMDMDGAIRRNTEELATKLLDIADQRVSHFQSENLRMAGQLEILQREVHDAREALALLRDMISPNARTRSAAERRARLFLEAMAAKEGEA